MTALGKAIAKGYKATHDGVTKLYRKTTNVFGMSLLPVGMMWGESQ